MNLISLGGIFAASLLGSWHCVGMCGPALTLATTMAPHFGLGVYHLGRLISYNIVALALHQTGLSIFNLLEHFQMGWIIIWALYAFLLAWAIGQLLGKSVGLFSFPKFFQFLLQKLMRSYPQGAPLLLGLATGFLPCFWLYGFFAVAAGAPSPLYVSLSISSFWLGTLPLLIASPRMVRHLKNKWSPQVINAVMVLLMLPAVYFTIQRSPWTHHDNSCPLHRNH